MCTLLESTPSGVYCGAGNFYIDPWRPVDKAIITHAHADHARAGSKSYLAAQPGVALLRERLGGDASIEGISYGATTNLNGVRVSLHPAGHILGSAQVRIERGGEVWVVSGDYKLAADPTCAPLEIVRCHCFVTESTFGLPIYRWSAEDELFRDINAWWQWNRELGRASILFTYSLGKSQRVLAGLDDSIGPILVHGAVQRYLNIYRSAGVRLPAVEHAVATRRRDGAIVIAPPSAAGSSWLRKFGDISTAIASGWMQIRGIRRRRVVDRGFPLSDHADWDGLLSTIRSTGAEQVWVTHGYTSTLVRWLLDRGIQVREVATHFEGELDTDEDVTSEP